MARTPKNGSGGPTEASATTLLLPSERTTQDLAKAKRSTRKRTQSLSGELGELIARAVETKHVDRKALKMACELDDLPDEKLHVVYFHLMLYLDQLGVTKRAKAQADLFEGRGEDGGKPKDNVTSIGQAARKVAEQAGADA